jgi:hypothetical protein
MLYTRQSSGTGTIGQLVADVPSGVTLVPLHETKKKQVSRGQPTRGDPRAFWLGQGFIILARRALHWILFSSSWVQSTVSYPVSLTLWSRYFLQIIFNIPVPISQKIHCVSITNISRLILFKKAISVCSDSHTKHINALCGDLLNVKASGTYSDHCFKGSKSNSVFHSYLRLGLLNSLLPLGQKYPLVYGYPDKCVWLFSSAFWSECLLLDPISSRPCITSVVERA